MTDTKHTLTDEQRKLLADCPRERIKQRLSDRPDADIADVCEYTNGELDFEVWRDVKRGAYIPRPAVEQWLAEQDANEAEQDANEAEIERRIGLLVEHPPSVEHFEECESGYERWILRPQPGGFCGYWGYSNPYGSSLDPEEISVPVPRIRAAIDKKREQNMWGASDEANRNADAIVQDMMEGPAAGINAQETDGPWVPRKDSHISESWSAHKLGDPYMIPIGATFRVSAWGEALAREKAEQAALELNAKHRQEQAAKQAEAEKQRRIAAFVERHKAGREGNWIWRHPDWDAYLNEDGVAYDRPKDGRVFTPRPELIAALREAGVDEPVELSEELRARLEKRLATFLVHGGIPFLTDEMVYLDSEGLVVKDTYRYINSLVGCTPAQARAFLAEKGIEIPTEAKP